MDFVHSVTARKHLLLHSMVCTAVLSVIIFHGCSMEESEPMNPQTGEPHGRVINSAGCKIMTGAQPDSGVPSDLDCVEYSYVEPGTLLLHHINAGFNCCPGELSGEVDITADSVIITEWESEYGCRCECPYDLEYKVLHLPPGLYHIHLIDVSHGGYLEGLQFDVDLNLPVSGIYCEEG